MNYIDAFIAVADDCPISTSAVPPERGKRRSVAEIQYELLAANPYTYTQEEVLFETHLRHKGMAAESESRREELWEEFFSKPQACLRSSPLPKRYGWGLHFDPEGKVALVPMDSDEYEHRAQGEREGTRVLKAMRSSRG